ncbi:hypothetical protein SAMN05216369_2781 [Marinobacter antarcticus]|uniref:Uncharacterized protein n=1 Tax=Marinobacter antarcticus TaxID=564117 RepID=A0A1M6UED4_9GAMM|nr:hypothetical protein [Marinobacter antarcticus]SHK67612.1 hypothetical protein SAMN05216369_2781 [Marinobacter antarcticus]
MAFANKNRDRKADLRKLIFATPAKVGNADRKKWEEEIEQEHGVELHVIEREEIIALMQMPGYASLLASALYLKRDIDPPTEVVVAKAKRAADIFMTRTSKSVRREFVSQMKWLITKRVRYWTILSLLTLKLGLLRKMTSTGLLGEAAHPSRHTHSFCVSLCHPN